MYKSKVFYTFQESNTLTNVINKIKLTTSTTSTSNNASNIFNEKLKLYMSTKANGFIKYHNSKLEYKDCEIYTMPTLPNQYIFAIIYTKTQYNHPYLAYIKLDDNKLNFLIPFGGEKTHGDYNVFYYAIEDSNYVERTAIFLLLEKTVVTRKRGIIESKQFSLFNCDNITNCIRKMHEIDKMNKSKSEKDDLRKHYNEYYIKKAYQFLGYYFTLLDKKEYHEALLFLKDNGAKYHGKERLNTFFKNTKLIIGHLEVFVPLYQLLHMVINLLSKK